MSVEKNKKEADRWYTPEKFYTEEDVRKAKETVEKILQITRNILAI
jgi:hypothetical protein